MRSKQTSIEAFWSHLSTEPPKVVGVVAGIPAVSVLFQLRTGHAMKRMIPGIILFVQ